MSFQNLELPDFLVKSLENMNITTPTPIQASAIPPGLEGRDILASAQTGTGKTVAYLVPLITRLLNSPTDTALVLAPTRELAIQVKEAAEKLLGRQIPHPVALLIGGAPMSRQLDTLKKNPRIVVGTPGRINDHLSRNSLKLQKTRFLVIDEADRMLDMGFEEDLENIMERLPEERQTFMFSATMPVNIVKLSQKYLTEPERISLGSSTKPSAQITQQTIHTTVSDKFTCLLKELDTREGSIIIFVKTKVGAENLAEKLKRENLRIEIVPGSLKQRRIAAIHGDLRQSRRNEVISAFRHQKLEILVATDVAARGLDIHHVRHVINYDPPQCADDYIHRIGRTGRAGLEGEAVSLILPSERQIWRKIDDFINQKSGVHPSNESSQRRGRATPYQKSHPSSFRSKPSARFQSDDRRFGGGGSQSEGRRFGGGGSQSEGRRFGGGGSQSEGRRFAGGASQSEGRRFAGGASQFEGRRFGGGGSQSEGRRFAGGASQSEGRRFAGGASQSEGRRFVGGASQFEGRRFSGGASQFEGRRFAGGASQFEGQRFAGSRQNNGLSRSPHKRNEFRSDAFDVHAGSAPARPSKTGVFPKISFRPKADVGYNDRRRRTD